MLIKNYLEIHRIYQIAYCEKLDCVCEINRKRCGPLLEILLNRADLSLEFFIMNPILPDLAILCRLGLQKFS